MSGQVMKMIDREAHRVIIGSLIICRSSAGGTFRCWNGYTWEMWQAKKAAELRGCHDMQLAALVLGALLKQYITDEGSKANGQGKQTKAEALAAKIMERAMHGKFQFVQFLADRIMGKVN